MSIFHCHSVSWRMHPLCIRGIICFTEYNGDKHSWLDIILLQGRFHHCSPLFVPFVSVLQSWRGRDAPQRMRQSPEKAPHSNTHAPRGKCRKPPRMWCESKNGGTICEKSGLVWCESVAALERPTYMELYPQVRGMRFRGDRSWEDDPHHTRRKKSQKPPLKEASHHTRAVFAQNESPPSGAFSPV